MAELNAVGDVILNEPRAMRVLADPSRLALHDALHRDGPATVDDLVSRLGSQPNEIKEHLEALESVGLVERREAGAGTEQTWGAIGKGVFLESPDDADGQDAARQLSNAMLLHYVDLPRRWVSDDEPRLPPAWALAAGQLNARLRVTLDELRDIQSALEAVLEPYLTRGSDETPQDVSSVRILSYFMPEPGPPEPP